MLDNSVKPVQNRPRKVAYALKDDLQKKITTLEEQKVIAKVDIPTPWISNCLAICKSNGTERVCIDPTDFNKAIQRNHFPLPTIEEVLPKLKDAKIFSLVDAKDCFLQVKLTNESSYLTTFWTPLGKYRWLRMTFGLTSSPEEFQRRLQLALDGLDGIFIVADDILIIGRGETDEEARRDHDENLDRLLRLARDSIYWPGMPNDIKQMIESCQACSKEKPSQQKETLRSHDRLSTPWAKVGIDLFTYANVTYLIMVDYYSDIFEFTKLVDQRAETTIQACKEQFARYDVPQIVQSDGGPQFISVEFQAFANNWEFKHSMSSPYQSQWNGKAESAVKIVKNFLKKSEDPLRAVLEWRNTLTSQINLSPVQRLMQRRTRASVPQAEQLMKPVVLTARQILRRKVKKQKMSQKYYDRNARDLSPLRRGTPVFVQSLKKYDASKWAQGIVADQCSNRSYIVEIEGRLLRRYLKIDHTIRPTPSTSTEQEGHRDGIHSPDTHGIPTDENTDSRELESCERPAVISTPRPEPVPTSPVKTNSPVKTRLSEVWTHDKS